MTLWCYSILYSLILIYSFDQGLSSTPVWIEDLSCYYSSTAGRYFCSFDGIGITDCTHSQDLAISCLAGKPLYNYDGVYLN